MQALNIRSFVFNFPSSWDYRPVPQGLDINNDFFSNVEVDLILLSPRHVGTLFWKWERSAGGGKFTGCPPLLRTRDCAASRHVSSSVPLSTDTVVVFEVGAEPRGDDGKRVCDELWSRGCEVKRRHGNNLEGKIIG